MLDFVDCPDRRIAACAAALVNAEATLPGVGVTAILPRRSYAPLVGRLLHDRTADKMAGVISRIPHAVATIVPFDVRSRVESLAARQADGTRRRPLRRRRVSRRTSAGRSGPGSPGTGTPRPGGSRRGTASRTQAGADAGGARPSGAPAGVASPEWPASGARQARRQR